MPDGPSERIVTCYVVICKITEIVNCALVIKIGAHKVNIISILSFYKGGNVIFVSYC